MNSQSTRFRQTLLVAIGLIAIFGATKHARLLAGSMSDVMYFVAFAFQLYAPLWLIRKEGTEPSDYGIHCYHAPSWILVQLRKFSNQFLPWILPYLPRPHYRFSEIQGLLKELRYVAFLSLITFIPYGVIYYLFFSYANSPKLLHFYPTLPVGFGISILTEIFLIALPEEIFYRGFLQTRLLEKWPNKKIVLGIPIGKAVIITNLFFALGHFVGEYQFYRLLPFFPGLLFSMLRMRSGSITGAVIYHASSNLFSAFLFQSIF